MDLHGSDTALCPPSAGTAEASSIARRGSTSALGYVTRGGSLLSIGARARKSARTHAPAGWWWWCAGGPCAFFAFPARRERTRTDGSTHARGARRRRASPLRTPHRTCKQRTQGAHERADLGVVLSRFGSSPRRPARPARRCSMIRPHPTLASFDAKPLFSPLSVFIDKTMSGHEKRGGPSGVGPLRPTGTTLRGHATGRPGSPAPAGWQLPARPPSRPRTTRRLAPW